MITSKRSRQPLPTKWSMPFFLKTVWSKLKNFIHKTISKIPSALEKFKNLASFVRLSLPSTPISHKNRAFQKELQTRLIWKRQLCIFVQTKNTLVTEPFDSFPFLVFFKVKSKMINLFLNFCGIVWTENVNFDVFWEWKRHVQISLSSCGQGLSSQKWTFLVTYSLTLADNTGLLS